MTAAEILPWPASTYQMLLEAPLPGPTAVSRNGYRTRAATPGP
jgi:hypothetical protein